MFAPFNRFALEIPEDCARDCSHPGPCDDDVAFWAPRIARPEDCTPEALAAELREFGAWDAGELSDDSANWHRIVWIAAGNVKESLTPEAPQ